MDRRLIRSIFSLSVPAIITNITTPLLSITDVAIVGHMGSAVFIAAIALGGTMFNMLYWLCGFLRMGSSGLTAQAFGGNDINETHMILARALALAFIIGGIFVVIQRPLLDVLLLIMDGDAATVELARDYFSICIWGAPAVLGTFVLTGWFVGMQDSRTPMWVSIFIDVLNILVSLTLVFGLKLRITGVAFGTLTAQWAGFLLGLGLCVRRNGWIKVTSGEIFDGGKIREFFRINADIFLRTLCLVAVTMWFTRVGSMQGALMLAVNALLMQLFTLFSFSMDGVAFAAEALCGRFKGAGDHKSLRDATRAILTAGGVLALLFTMVYVMFGSDFLQLLSSDGDVVSKAKEYFVWAMCIPLAGFGAFMWDGVFIGITRTRAMLWSMAMAAAVYFVCYFVLFPEVGNHGLWIAFLSYLFVRGAALTVAGRRYLF